MNLQTVNMIAIEKMFNHAPMTALGDRLKNAREAAGFKSAASAARRLGTPEATYRAHENGQNSFSIDDAMRYARVFKVNPSWLVFGTDPQNMEFPDREGSIDPKTLAFVVERFERFLRDNRLFYEPDVYGEIITRLYQEAMESPEKLDISRALLSMTGAKALPDRA